MKRFQLTTCALVDPIDYFRPLVYDPDDERWAKGSDAAYKFRAHCN